MVGKYTGYNDPLTKGHLSQGNNTLEISNMSGTRVAFSRKGIQYPAKHHGRLRPQLASPNLKQIRRLKEKQGTFLITSLWNHLRV